MVIEYFIIERERITYRSATVINKGGLLWLVDRHQSPYGKVLSIS